jgi:hypothetical protein
MMPLRRASALVMLCLLTSAETASAECAWVMWGQDRASVYWPIGDGHKSLENCQDRADRFTKRDKDKGDEAFVYSCLPDTIDPRGLKGK